MTEHRTRYRTGPSSLFLLFIVFLVLKLCSVIDWSWWFVTMPLWGGVAVIFAIVVVVFVVAVIADRRSTPRLKRLR